MKKIFTLLAVAAMAISANAQGSMVQPTGPQRTFLYMADADANTNPLNAEMLGVDEGWSLSIINAEGALRDDKNLSKGNVSFNFMNQDMQTIKLSNGAINKVQLPEGRYAVQLTILASINKDAATDRPCYWAEVAGVKYAAPLAEGATPEEGVQYGKLIDSFKSETPDIQQFAIPNLNEFTFKNSGEQPMVVLMILHTDQAPEQGALAVIAADENAPVEYYNLQGVRVENPANGLFIRKQGSKVTKVVL